MWILTERHYQRASNHNREAQRQAASTLKGIIKEHQITTGVSAGTRSRLLKGIIKEHQITTALQATGGLRLLKGIIKEHQITTASRGGV